MKLPLSECRQQTKKNTTKNELYKNTKQQQQQHHYSLYVDVSKKKTRREIGLELYL